MNEDGIVKICETLGIAYGQLRNDPRHQTVNMSISCPLAVKTHGDPTDGNMSCSVQVVDDGPSKVRCFSGNCAFKGSLLRLIKLAIQYRGNPPELAQLLKDVAAVEEVTLVGMVARASKSIAKEFALVPPRNDREVIPERKFEPFAGKIPQYAIQRGISVATAKAWGLGYDKDAGYLVFPVRRRDGKLVGMVGRSVHKDSDRPHHNYWGLDKTKHLFGAHMLVPGKPVVVVESCIDALNTWQALGGEVSVVASLGEGFSDTHAKMISAMRPPEVYVFTDGDAAGRVMGSKIVYGLFGRGWPVKLMECPWGPIIDATADGRAVHKKVDPSNLPPEYIRALFASAKIQGRSAEWTEPPPVYDAAAA